MGEWPRGAWPRVFALSDLHTDYPENLDWVRGLSDDAFKADAVVLGGDVSDDLTTLETTLRLFTSKFKHVFFVPGNHDLWIRAGRGEQPWEDSVSKLEAVLSLCEACGVHTRPVLVGGGDDGHEHEDEEDGDGDRRMGGGGGDDGSVDSSTSSDVRGPVHVWVAPVLAWYHTSFDTEPDVEHARVRPPHRVMADFRLCKWPPGLDPNDTSVAAFMDRVNDERQGWDDFLDALEHGTESERRADVITFSHFLPRLELCPEKRMLFYPNLPKAVGSDYILRRIAPLATVGRQPQEEPPRTHVHVFGHTHFGWDHTIDGIRYIQAPVSYPSEWEQRPGSLVVGPDARGTNFDLCRTGPSDAPLCIWDARREARRRQSTAGETAEERDGGDGRFVGFVPEMRARWSDHYKEHPREPHNTELMWWVKRYLDRGSGPTRE